MAVPTVYAKLIELYDSASSEEQAIMRESVARLELMVSGSAALDVSVMKKWHEVCNRIIPFAMMDLRKGFLRVAFDSGMY